VDLWLLNGPVPAADHPADLFDSVLVNHSCSRNFHFHLLLHQLQGTDDAVSLINLTHPIFDPILRLLANMPV